MKSVKSQSFKPSSRTDLLVLAKEMQTYLPDRRFDYMQFAPG
jgi:hypothetical protein